MIRTDPPPEAPRNRCDHSDARRSPTPILWLPPELVYLILSYIISSPPKSPTSLLRSLIATSTDLLHLSCARRLPPLPSAGRSGAPGRFKTTPSAVYKASLLPLQRSCRALFELVTPLVYSHIRVTSLWRAERMVWSLEDVAIADTGSGDRSALYAHCTGAEVKHLHPSDGIGPALSLCTILAKLRSRARAHRLDRGNVRPTVVIRQCAFSAVTWVKLRRGLENAGWRVEIREGVTSDDGGKLDMSWPEEAREVEDEVEDVADTETERLLGGESTSKVHCVY